MVWKTPSNKLNGFTFLELMLVMAVVMIFLVTTMVVYNPIEGRAKARDNKRISDLFTLERIITEYHVDKGTFPDAEHELRLSTEAPNSSTISLDNSEAGWINQDLRTYSTFLPLDPLNDIDHHYSYIHDGETYEINVVLEKETSFMVNDGGNDDQAYEIGTNLSLITP